MWVVIDKRAPEKIKENLRKEFDLFEFSSSNITYNEVSGHPDIFMFQGIRNLIIAPNTPIEFIDFLNKESIAYNFGLSKIGKDLVSSTPYNCIESKSHFFHKNTFSDDNILEAIGNKTQIKLPQAYTRCSLTMLDERSFITADKGISKVLKQNNFEVLEINDKEILLEGFKNGFFGGTNGILNNKMYLMGSLKHHKNGEEIKDFINSHKLELIELYDGPLFDGGGLFFLQ